MKIKKSVKTKHKKAGTTYWSDVCVGVSGSSSILIILAAGEVDSGENSSLLASWTDALEATDFISAEHNSPPTSVISILISGF